MSSAGVAFAALAAAVTTSAAPVTPDGFDLARVAITDADGSVTTIAMWIAATPDQRGRGLMGATELGAADGMLFVFDTEAEWRFYMWHTVMPLSIAYFDAGGAFVGSDEMAPCTASSGAACERYSPDAPYRYAIELPAGDVARLGIGTGDRIEVLPASWWQRVTTGAVTEHP